MSHRTILALSIVPLLLAGCFGSHGNGSDAGRIDASPRVDAGPRIDGGWIFDGAICDCFCGAIRLECRPDGSCVDVCPDAGPSECPPAPADLLCDFSHVSANTPTTIPIALQGCYCEGHVDCSAFVSGEYVLDLSTSDCSDPDIDCDDCASLEGTCDIPALDEGTWQVNINGQPALTLEVTPEDVLPERGSTCLRRGGRDESCGVGWPPASFDASTSCHPTHARPDERVAITVTNPCGGCGMLAGPCEVDVFDDVIRVQPSSLFSLCDVDCPAICTSRDDVCWTPRLEEGTWRIIVDGLDAYESQIVVSDAPAPGDVCGPFFPHD